MDDNPTNIVILVVTGNFMTTNHRDRTYSMFNNLNNNYANCIQTQKQYNNSIICCTSFLAVISHKLEYIWYVYNPMYIKWIHSNETCKKNSFQ